MRLKTTLMIMSIMILLVFTTSCNGDTDVKFVTGNVIYGAPTGNAPVYIPEPVEDNTETSEQPRLINNTPDQGTSVSANDTGTESQPSDEYYGDILQDNDEYNGIKIYDNEEEPDTIQTKQEELLNSIKCDKEKVILGYHSCYRLNSGNAVITLKNQGKQELSGLWFNIEVDEKKNYESVTQKMGYLQYAEFVLPLNTWETRYRSSDRIIIMPEIITINGNKACPNLALLLEPLQNCNALQ